VSGRVGGICQQHLLKDPNVAFVFAINIQVAHLTSPATVAGFDHGEVESGREVREAGRFQRHDAPSKAVSHARACAVCCEQVPAQQQYSMVNYFVCSKPIDPTSVLCTPLPSYHHNEQ
jgi:hypothetical protein